MASCPKCQRAVEAAWKFCRFCGQAIALEAPEPAELIGGRLPSEVLARRIRPQEMQGLLNKTLAVEEGHVALLFVGGRNDATLGPGKHSIVNVLRSGGRDVSVAMFRTSDVSLDISVGRLLTSDPLPLTLDFRLALKLEKPILLWQNLVRGAESYGTEHLAASLYPLIEEGCESFVVSRSIRELDSHEGTRQELQVALSSHLEQPVSRWGIRLVSLQALSLRSDAWDRINQSRTEYFVAASDEDVALEGRKRLFDVHQESDIQAMAEETASVAGISKRIGLWDRLRRAIQANARGEIESRTELEDMVRQADKDRLLKEAEHEALIQTLDEAKEDSEKANAFALRRVETEGEFELRKLDLGHRYGLEQERLALEISTARQEMEARWGLELRQVDLEIAKERRLAQFQRELEAEDQASSKGARLDEAKSAAAIEDVARDQDAKDAELALNLYSQYKGAKREDEVVRERALLDAEEKRLAMSVEAEGQRVEMRLKESREQHDYELKRIEALSSAGIETLIAVSGPEQAQLLAQLARTRALSDSTPEQILAMQVQESPQVAEALKEILTATAANGQLEQYERLVVELKESARLSREDHQQNIKTMTEMFNKALDTVKDTAVAFSGQASSPTQAA